MDRHYYTIEMQNNPSRRQIIQINLEKSNVATAHLEEVITETKPAFILFQEPRAINNKILGIPLRFQITASQINPKCELFPMIIKILFFLYCNCLTS